jgi:hypothetical protein
MFSVRGPLDHHPARVERPLQEIERARFVGDLDSAEPQALARAVALDGDRARVVDRRHAEHRRFGTPGDEQRNDENNDSVSHASSSWCERSRREDAFRWARGE